MTGKMFCCGQWAPDEKLSHMKNFPEMNNGRSGREIADSGDGEKSP